MRKTAVVLSVTFIVITGYFIGATLMIREKTGLFVDSSNSTLANEQNKKAMN